MPIYNLINPSDAYTFIAPSDEAAAVSVLFLSHGAYGAESTESDFASPIFSFSGEEYAEQWFKENFGHGLSESLDKHLEIMPEVLESFLIASKAERETIDLACSMVSNEQARELRLKFHDNKRSSTNNIGKVAWNKAERLRWSNANKKGG